MHLDDFHFKKNFGQNFLKEENIVEKIKNVAGVLEHSLIIEIGPGAGSLTEKIASIPNCEVLAYEIDPQLKPILEEKFVDSSHVHFIFDDFLKRDLKSDIESFSYQHLYILANLPYYITTPIIEKIIEELPVDKMVLMVQKEVADRFVAKPGTKQYNSLSIFLQSYFDIKREFIVSRNCFVPKPNVDSAVVSFTKRAVSYPIYDRPFFEKFVRDSFQFKRKNLRNNLKNYDLNLLEHILESYQYSLSNRAEEIPIEVFVEISNEIGKKA